MNIIHHNKSVTVDEMAVVILDFLDIKSGTVVGVIAIKGEVAEVVSYHGFGPSSFVPLSYLVWVP